MILKDKTILVSGVGPGLGSEIARRVLRDGGQLVIGARNGEKLATIAKELDPSGERVLAHPFDITDEEACKSIVVAAEERFGRLDGLAQVAASEPMGDLADQGLPRDNLSPRQLRRTLSSSPAPWAPPISWPKTGRMCTVLSWRRPPPRRM